MVSDNVRSLFFSTQSFGDSLGIGFIPLDHTKNGDRREIPINATFRSTLQGITRRLDCPYVFYAPSSGRPYADVKRSFKTAVKHAKIADVKFHDRRHTFASHLVMAGVDLTTVKELLGHKDIKMTLRYAHLASSHKVKAVEIYDRSMSGYNLATRPGEEKVASV